MRAASACLALFSLSFSALSGERVFTFFVSVGISDDAEYDKGCCCWAS